MTDWRTEYEETFYPVDDVRAGPEDELAWKMVAEIEKLRAALKPFAEYSEHYERVFGTWQDGNDKDEAAIGIGGDDPHPGVTKGMCREARSILSPQKSGADDG